MSAAKPLPEALLMDYAAGTASPAISLLMASHVAMSSEAKSMFGLMESVGGALFDDLDNEPLERISAKSALALLDKEDSGQGFDPFPDGMMPTTPLARDGAPASFDREILPAPLRQAEATVGGDLGWRKLGIGVAAAKLAVSTGRDRAHLLWAKGGTGIATHRHVGREVVLVLKGAFWDDGVLFEPGDVAVCEDGSIHTPRIDDSEDCVCLAVTEAPIHYTGLSGVILNRFCRF